MKFRIQVLDVNARRSRESLAFAVCVFVRVRGTSRRWRWLKLGIARDSGKGRFVCPPSIPARLGLTESELYGHIFAIIMGCEWEPWPVEFAKWDAVPLKVWK